MSRLGRDKLRKRETSFGVDRSQAVCLFEAFDLGDLSKNFRNFRDSASPGWPRLMGRPGRFAASWWGH